MFDKFNKKIEDYLKPNFPQKKLERDENLRSGQEGVEPWGFNKILILVREKGNTVYFNFVFQKPLEE